MLLWPEVCCFSCMNEQMKCMEMLLRNFLYSLVHCIAPWGTSILEAILSNIYNQLTESLCTMFNWNNILLVTTTFLFLLWYNQMALRTAWRTRLLGSLTHISSHPGATFIHTKCWACNCLNNTWNPAWSLLKFLPFSNNVVHMRKNTTFSPPFCIASNWKMRNEAK